MITDDMLSAAAQAVALCMESGISEEPHTFSQRFERKIGRLTRRANHPVLYRVRRSVVAAVLVLVIAFGSLMALSPQVRAAVTDWVRTTIGLYFIPETTTPHVTYEYTMPDTLYGYDLMLSNIDDTANRFNYVYQNEDGDTLIFRYSVGGNILLHVNMRIVDYEPGYVGRFPADIYIAHNNEQNSLIIWQDPNNSVFYLLSVRADSKLLIEIAETIESFKKIIE